MKNLFIFLIALGICNVGWAAKSKAICKIEKTFGLCKKASVFERLDKGGCVKAASKCRVTFCKANCFHSKPEKEKLIKLCATACNPSQKDMGPAFGGLLERDERNAYWGFYGTKRSKREQAITDERNKEDSRIPQCEDECDYDAENPKCERASTKKGAPWDECLKKCAFIPDIRKHAENCMARAARMTDDVG
ncbi:MAG: hypothetical protein WCG05_04790 [Alphaproteobacteria bacterium]